LAPFEERLQGARSHHTRPQTLYISDNRVLTRRT